MDDILHPVGDLPTPERSAVESIIGHALRDDQWLYIAAIDGAAEPTIEARRQAWDELNEIIAEAHQNVRDSGVSLADLERTIDDACHEVRYGK
jgi:hypothetical protein